MTRYYSNVAVETALSSSVSDTATTLPVLDTTGFPVSYPFTLILEKATANEELVDVTAVAGLNLTVTRGVGGTSGIAHSLGATVEHGVDARDFEEARDHSAGTTGVHGATGAVVGTTDTQTLTNKTLTAPTVADFTNANHDHGDADDGGNIPISSVTSLQTILDAKTTATESVATDLTTHEADTSTHGVTTVAGLDEVQTFTNKTTTDLALQGDTAVATGHTFTVTDMSPVNERTITDFDRTNTSYGATGVAATVVAPASGIIRIDAWARAVQDTAGETAYMTYQCYQGTSAAGTLVRDASASRAGAMSGTNPQNIAITELETGLTPGASYYFRLMSASSTGGTQARLSVQSLTVTPQL